jgi:hypothetical protein
MRQPDPIPAGRLWAGVLIAPVAWIAQGGLGWYFGWASCTVLTIDGARLVIGTISLVALVAALAGLAIAWGNWGHVAVERHVTRVKGRDRVEFMSAGGVLASGMFAIGIAWAGLTSVLLHQCGGMR